METFVYENSLGTWIDPSPPASAVTLASFIDAKTAGEYVIALATFREALKAVIAATTAADLAQAWSAVAKASNMMHRAKSAEAAARAAAAWARVPDRAPEPEETDLDDDWKSVYEATLAHEHALEVCCTL
jgi:aminopeptidase N